MRNLFDTLSNTVGQFGQQGNPNNSGNNKGGSALGQIGAMGVGGLLGALVSGDNRNLKKTVKKVAMVGGGAALGGLAYSMYQKWRNQPAQGQQPYQGQPQGYPNAYQGQGGYAPQQGGYAPQQGGYAPQQGGYIPQGQPAYNGGYAGQPMPNQAPPRYQQQVGYQAPTGTPFPQSRVPVGAGALANDPFSNYNSQQQAFAPEVNSDAISDLLLEAMVFAARADNHIDDSERQMILKMANELKPTQDLMGKIQEFLNEPLDPNTIARKMPNPAMAPDIYRLSASAIVADTPSERQYLQSLARALGLSQSQVDILNKEAMQFRLQQMQ